jgi:hypothetical protein
MAEVVRVVDFPLGCDNRTLWLNANCVRQDVLCYLEPVSTREASIPSIGVSDLADTSSAARGNPEDL